MSGRVKVDETIATSFDGTRLAVRMMGAEGAPALLVVNGIGANLGILRAALEDLAGAHRIVTWDLRGLLDSGPPLSDRIDAGAHAEDALAVLGEAGFESARVLSWSTGGRIAFELAARAPEQVEALVVVCGTPGRSLTQLRFLEPTAALPFAAGIAKHFAGWLGGSFRGLVAKPEFAGLLRQSGLVGARADTRAIVELFEGLAASDPAHLLAVYEGVEGDSAIDLLRELDARVLLIGGERDPFAPVRIQRAMDEALPRSSLIVYKGATHYLPAEFPKRLAEDVSAFLAEASPG